MWFPFLVEADVPTTVAAAFEDLTAAVRSASYRVRDELKTARFEVDEEWRPVDAGVVTAIEDATLAQLAFWAETGDMSGAAAQSGGGSILSVSLPGGSGTTDPAAKQAARVAPAAAEALRNCDGIEWAVTYR